MAAHGKTGAELQKYREKKLKPHKVSGVYTSGGQKNIVLTLDEFKVTLRKRGGGKGGQVIHYAPYTCEGRHRPFVKEVKKPDLATVLNGEKKESA